MEALGPLVQFLPIILVIVLFVVLIVRPQQGREKKHKAMLAALEKGDIVVTSGGLHGRVKATGGDSAVLRVNIADGVDVDILRSSITYTKKGGELIEG